MLFVAGRLPADLARQGSGAEVAGGADLQGNASSRQKIHGALVAHYADSVPDTLRSQDFDGLTDEFRPSDFSGMDQAMHALARYVFINVAKVAGGKPEFIAANPVGDDVRIAQFRCNPGDFHRRGRAPLANRVENVFEPDSGHLGRGVPKGGKVGHRVLFAPEHDANGESDLGV